MALCAAEDLEAEQDEMDSSVGSMLGLLDTTPDSASPKSIKHHVSGVTGGRSGLKLCRQKQVKLVEQEGKKSPRKLSPSSAGCKRLLRKSSSEAPTAAADEMDVSEDKATTTCNAAEDEDIPTAVVAGQPLSSEKKGMQRITRRNSDLKLVESSSIQTELADGSNVTIEDVD